MRPENILRQCNNWRDFKSCLEPLTKKQKGDCFEALTLYYLELSYKYQQLLKNVWLLSEVPTTVLGKVGLERPKFGCTGLAASNEHTEPVCLNPFTTNYLPWFLGGLSVNLSGGLEGIPGNLERTPQKP